MTVDKGIFIQNIYYMLSYAFQILKQEDYRNVAGEKFDKIHDLFAAILEKGVSRQLKQGLYREYVPMQEKLSVMRGKLNMNSTIQLKVQQKQKLSCEFDEFSEDNLYNQILKVTIHRLIRAEDVAPERKQALKKLIVFFGNVQLIQTDHIAWNRLIYQRNNRNYELLLNICYLVLKHLLQTTDDGQYKLIEFSDEQMNLLFQRFVFEYFNQEHKELSVSAPTMKWSEESEDKNSLISFLPIMKTDIVLKDKHSDKTLIIDTKYYKKIFNENFGKQTINPAHLYQIFAYVKNMDKENTGNVSGLLLYAKTEDEMFPEGEPFVIGGNSIGARTLDLNVSFDKLRIQLDNIAEECFK
ncbi:5-methylcytosine-specific restriction enzyme subunit McrC [Ruminococcus sp. YE71]|uniref:5-methylcytosine-specific restriction endonuclease system specificity protein McrC n=1 Tax=unclassified Ruminococcus TaxID=2608920 RepID=UPI00088FF291|nr:MULTISPECIES: 5-methylcytosine-specific restriction endonuclease system specificity protein McrC [unclassified Ruminococcus]SDA29987.1 5-methylcytosine-specific restriction enzyme subunit McrC [Ruminococcus sp. YE78]SFW49076.1 5-methylcytosine-specific restriction enzyme subunit McrC [Ruminococcus sp. YE71]